MRYLAISFEPWENEVMAHTLLEIKKRNNESNVAIVIADLWSYEQNIANVKFEKLKENHDFKFYTYFTEYEKWQNKEKEINYNKEIQRILYRNGIKTSSGVIAFTDHIFSCFERKPYYNKMSMDDKERVFYHFLCKTEAILNEFNPDIILTIERNYLVKNIFFEFAKNKNIDLFTLLFARMGKRLYLDCGDGIGTSVYTKKRMALCRESELNQAKQWIEKYQSQDRSSQTLYKGLTEKIVKQQKQSFFNYFIEKVKDLFRVLAIQVYFMVLDRNKSLKVYSAKPLYCFYNTLITFIRSLIGYFDRNWIFSDYPTSKNYFYYPLHYRPESSSLSLSDGLDDEVVIELISRWLPLGCTLAVKENSTMIEHRETKFYKKIKSIPSVELISNRTSSLDLIHNSLGVISLSGTALMEARFLGKPAAAVGKPEFSEIVNCNDLTGLKDFLVKCYNKSYPHEVDDKTVRYVATILSCKMEFDLDWSLLKNKEQFAKQLIEEIEFAQLNFLSEETLK